MFSIGVLEFLHSRNLIHDCSSGDLASILNQEPITLYMGVDPTALGFHLGHLFALRVLSVFQRFGHRVILVIGGATGLVGDPTGRDTSRRQLSSEEVTKNAQSLQAELEILGLLSFTGENPALLLNNAVWLGEMSFLHDFMPLAFQFSVNAMLKMTTFSSRLEAEKPLSLGELIYPVMQAWDFLVLCREYQCTLQVGGQDQWPNILWGVHIIKSLENVPTFGLTFPLLLDQEGKKMGKTSEGETLWLDPTRTTPLKMFQYVQGFPDQIVWSTFLRMTDLTLKEIETVAKNPRDAQLRLAFEIVKLVHGDRVARETFQDFQDLASGASSSSVPKICVQFPVTLTSCLVDFDALLSKREVRQLIQGGAVWILDDSEKPPKIYDIFFEVTELRVIRYSKNKFLRITTTE